jgi:hypothetical protein
MLYTQATEIGTDQCACLSMAEAVLSPSRTPPTGAAHHLSAKVAMRHAGEALQTCQ